MISTYPLPDALLSDKFLNKYKDKQPKWGFNNLGLIIFKRTYARRKSNGELETWAECLTRCIRGAQKIGAKYTHEEAERLFDHMFNMRCCFSGRSLWQLGTPTVDKIGMDSLLNCWQTKISEVEDFIFIVIESMLGGGVGCNIAKEYTHELSRVKSNVVVEYKNTKDADFIIPDSKEGWADLVRKILEAYLITGKSFTYSTICIRSSGEPIKTFGGIAPGPQPLIDYAKTVVKILEARAGKKLRTQDVADIICCGGQMVKSGGVRRTALILQGDVDDTAYLLLKRWDLGNIPNYRANSNNSLLCSSFDHLSSKFWEGYNGNGEPYGLLNVPLARKFGRLGESTFDGFNLVDNSIIGFNPCAEATLADKECCNLATLAINNLNSIEEMIDCAILLYKTQKAIAAGPYLFEETNKIVHKNMRLGLSVAGICQRMSTYEKWCDETYKALRRYDKEWSKTNGHAQSIRLTVMQPNGTLGLLLGSTPGGHPGFAEYVLRRVRFAGNDPLIPILIRNGIPVEPEIQYDGTFNHDTLVASFPTKFDKDTLFSENCTALQQLDIVKSLQTCWADQAVSVTVYYEPHELNDVKKWLEQNYDNCVKSISFLLKENHNFKQAPLEKIDEATYNAMLKGITPILEENIKFGDEIATENCVGGACPIK